MISLVVSWTSLVALLEHEIIVDDGDEFAVRDLPRPARRLRYLLGVGHRRASLAWPARTWPKFG